jgi:hypothetical protein
MSHALVFSAFAHCFRTLSLVVVDLVRLAPVAVHSHSALAAENLFLRKQLAIFQERKVKPRRADDATEWMMAALSRMFRWGNSLVNVKAGYARPMTAQRISVVLALEVQTEDLACPRTSES